MLHASPSPREAPPTGTPLTTGAGENPDRRDFRANASTSIRDVFTVDGEKCR